jgi:hypothetical protein
MQHPVHRLAVNNEPVVPSISNVKHRACVVVSFDSLANSRIRVKAGEQYMPTVLPITVRTRTLGYLRIKDAHGMSEQFHAKWDNVTSQRSKGAMFERRKKAAFEKTKESTSEKSKMR